MSQTRYRGFSRKIYKTNLALEWEFLQEPFTEQASHINYLCDRLLRKLSQTNYSDSQKEVDRHVIVGGALAVALSNDKFHNTCRATYPLPFAELWEKCALDKISDGSNERDLMLVTMILDAGTKILNGELPFDSKVLSDVFPRLSNEIETIADFIDIRCVNQPYVSAMFQATRPAFDVESIFCEALALCQKNESIKNTPAMQTFMTELRKLKNHTGKKLESGTASDYEQCRLIALNAKMLAERMATNTLNSEHIHAFDRATRYLRTDKKLGVLLGAILGAAIAVAAAVATLGLAIPAAAVGVAAAGGLAIGAMFTLWCQRKYDPQIQLVETAKAIQKLPTPRA